MQIYKLCKICNTVLYMEDLSELKQKAFWAEVGQGLGSLRPATLTLRL